jgi:hypothetical protein
VTVTDAVAEPDTSAQQATADVTSPAATRQRRPHRGPEAAAVRPIDKKATSRGWRPETAKTHGSLTARGAER